MNFDETRLTPRLERHEEAISLWKYGGEYAFYNAEEPFHAAHPEEAVDPNSFVWLDRAGALLGHVSYGPDGRIPTAEGYEYTEDLLDVGLGLRPDLCGRGLGADFLAMCLRFARERYGKEQFRLSVASFNQRAVRAYQKAGFAIECQVTHRVFHNKFYIMTGMLAGKSGGSKR